MPRRPTARSALSRASLTLALAGASGAAFAIQVCELNGQPINPDNGNTTAGKTGLMRVGARGARDETATGTHRSFDADGHLRSERSFDERGRLKHERELDEHGSVVRDDDVFEDGSRKAVGR